MKKKREWTEQEKALIRQARKEYYEAWLLKRAKKMQEKELQEDHQTQEGNK